MTTLCRARREHMYRLGLRAGKPRRQDRNLVFLSSMLELHGNHASAGRQCLGSCPERDSHTETLHSKLVPHLPGSARQNATQKICLSVGGGLMKLLGGALSLPIARHRSQRTRLDPPLHCALLKCAVLTSKYRKRYTTMILSSVVRDSGHFVCGGR